MEPTECFVVMPFGVKLFPDGSGRTYDFDKVYRVIIQRAIREAGMVPIRADERVTSAIIHSDMFRDLRDRTVVLADLSLDNPNVFYELGMRHVMSSSGTVLMCRKGSQLPFDVKLSRTIFYEFDGLSLDWEEVENVLKRLKVSLEEARKGLPDSPVHALLQTVLPSRNAPGPLQASALSQREKQADAEPLTRYQQLVAETWDRSGADPEALFNEHRGSVFGSRALAYLHLRRDAFTDLTRRLANHLNDGQQYQLANALYERLHAAGQLTHGSMLAYASSYSEAHADLAGADRAIALAAEALAQVKSRFSDDATAEAIAGFAECHRRLGGLWQWRWQLTRAPEDLDRAIAAFDEAVRTNDRARTRGVLRHPGFLAQTHLKQLVLYRIRDGNVERPDHEGHLTSIMALQPQSGDDEKGLSYLGWFQAVALADMGAAEQSERKALSQFTADATLKWQPQHWEIGRRQYLLLRRFLEQYAPHLRNPTLIGRISQILQAGD